MIWDFMKNVQIFCIDWTPDVYEVYCMLYREFFSFE